MDDTQIEMLPMLGEFSSIASQYEHIMFYYESGIQQIVAKLQILNNEFKNNHERNPIENIKSRVKSLDSIIDKMKRKGIPLTTNAMKREIKDIAGVRVICPFISDVYQVANMLVNQADVEIVTIKDYIKKPKENGYRSLHMIVLVDVYFSDHKDKVPIEIQFRTIAMNFWASTEHQLRYKKSRIFTEEMQQELIANISHDLRTPLTSISGNASNLLSNGETLDTETRNKICTDIFDDAQWLIGLVENLLSITRIEDGRMNLQISPQLMDEMIEEALHHVNRKSCEHTITTQYGDEILLVNVDARLIMQVVVNLVDNAIKYTPVGSVIQISAYRKDHQVVVEVADNGPGIPDRAKAQVFEMFYTGQSRIADSHRSLGLGLPLCRAILTAHGGTLTLRDNIPNGSVFSFALPQSEVNIHE